MNYLAKIDLSNNSLIILFLLLVFAISGCNEGLTIDKSRLNIPELVTDVGNGDFSKDVTISQLYDVVGELPALKLEVTVERDFRADRKGKVRQAIKGKLIEQLTANSIVLSEHANAKLNVHIINIGVPDTRKQTGEIKLAKVRLGAWITLNDGESPIFQSVVDGCIYHGPTTPAPSAYIKAGQDSVSRLVRDIRRIPVASIVRKNKALEWSGSDSTRIVSIGISRYEDPSIPPITYAANDAKAFAEFARGTGVPSDNITLLVEEQATRSKIFRSIKKLESNTESGEIAIFYFSGHGIPYLNSKSEVEGMLVPYDAAINTDDTMELTCIKQGFIYDKMSELPGMGIVILDACFSGKENSTRGLVAKGVKAIGVSGIIDKPFVPKQHLCYITATSGGHYANDYPEKRRGLFSYYFLKALEGEVGVDGFFDGNQDQKISINEAFGWTKAQVKNVAQKKFGRFQVPEMIGASDMVLTIQK